MGTAGSENKGSGYRMFRYVWSISMTFVYHGVSYLVLFTPYLLRYNVYDDPSGDQNLLPRLILGIFLFLYGLARGYRVWRHKR